MHQPQAVGAGFDDVAVVADQDDGALVVVDRHDQRFAAVDVEMVGRFVEDENVRGMEGGKREQQPRLLAARQRVAARIGKLRAEAIGTEPGAALGFRLASGISAAK